MASSMSVRWLWACSLATLFGCGDLTGSLFPPDAGAPDSGDGGQGDTGGGGAGGGGAGGGGGDTCSPGAACDGPSYCCDGASLLGCLLGYRVVFQQCGEGETCEPSGGRCACTAGARRCVPDAPTAVEECVTSGAEQAEWMIGQCEQGESCVAGDCKHVCDACDPAAAALACAGDGDTVLACQIVAGSICQAEMIPVLKCSEAGMKNGCVAPPGQPPSDPAQYCVNECNVRGAPLTGDLCGAPPDVLCAVLVCSADGQALELDHTSCGSGGQACSDDAECASCNCNAGFCFGSFVKPCPVAERQCP